MLPVTRGCGPETYSLYVPLFFGDIHRLDGFTNAHGEPTPFELFGVTATLATSPTVSLLRIGDWSTEDEAEQAFGDLRKLLLHLVSSQGAAIFGGRHLDAVDRQAHPIRDYFPNDHYLPWSPRSPPTDGGIWPSQTCILPEHERIVEYPVGFGRQVKIIDPNVFQLAEIGSGDVGDQPTSPDERLMLAVDLIAEGNGQRSRTLELLNLVRALEVLTKPANVVPRIRAIVDHWDSEIDDRISEISEELSESFASDLKRLLDRLGFLRQESISESLVSLAGASYPYAPPQSQFRQPDDSAQAVREVYDVRSKLIHTGTVPKKGGREGIERINDCLPLVRHLVACAVRRGTKELT
jgi:hypothetical protein